MRRKQRAIFTVVLTMLVAVSLAGCPKNAYDASMAASLDVSNGVSDGIKVLGELKTDGSLNAAEISNYAGYLGSLTTLNETFRASVKQIHASGQTGKAAYLSAASTFVTNANNPQLLVALHIDNPAAQAKIQTFMLTIKTALDGIQTAINKAKGA